MKTIIFKVKRVAPRATSLRDVDAFIEKHESGKADLVVKIDRAGVGDVFADRLEGAGFMVRRTHQG